MSWSDRTKGKSQYVEKRVYVKVFGALKKADTRLVAIPSVPGKAERLHTLAAQSFVRLAEAAEQALGIKVLAASGWREHRWESWEQYKKTMEAKYGSLEEGRKKMAFDSPHETGLAVDFGTGGLEPKSATTAAQRETKLHMWLEDNAHEYGFHPYKNEPWHWEHGVSQEAFASGVIGEDDTGYDPPTSFAAGDDDEFVEEEEEEDAAAQD